MQLTVFVGVFASCGLPMMACDAAVVLLPTDADLHIYANCVAFKEGKYDVLYGKDEVISCECS